MAYQVADGLLVAKKLAKGVPFTQIDMTVCNMVSAAMWKFYPWRDALKVFTPVTLADSAQDVSTGLTDILRMTQFSIQRTDVTPQQERSIDVAKSLTADLVPRSPYSIRAASYQAGINQFRLESAVRIPAGSTFKLAGEYQPRVTLFTDATDEMWFADDNLEVFAKGVAHWALKLADNSTAGELQTDDQGRARFTGMLGEFMKALADMAAAEDFGNLDGYFPDDSMGSVDGRRWYANDLFPYLL